MSSQNTRAFWDADKNQEVHRVVPNYHNQPIETVLKDMTSRIESLEQANKKLKDEIMNLWLLGDHNSKPKSPYEMSAEEYLNLENKL